MKMQPNAPKRISIREQSVPVVFQAGRENGAHASLAETFRKFEERLERSGRSTKRADKTGPVCPAEVIVFLAARERTYSASKYIPREADYVQRSHGTENKHHGPVVSDFSVFRFLHALFLPTFLSIMIIDLLSESYKL